VNSRAPWWGALLLGLLAYARGRYPEHQALIDSLIAALVGAWGGKLSDDSAQRTRVSNMTAGTFGSRPPGT
jgi:hypothetical protein